MKKPHRASIAVVICVSIALVTACSKKKPADTAPKPRMEVGLAVEGTWSGGPSTAG